MREDRVVWQRELLSVDSLARMRDVVPLETGDPRWPVAVPVPLSPDGVTIEFEPPEADWQDADQLVVALFVPPGANPYARLRIDCASSTVGLQGNDYTHCYYRYLHEGWGRLAFPYENMLIFGIPDAWHQVSRVRLTLSGSGEGQFMIAGMSIEHRERVRGPRLTDEELFDELNLDWPGLQEVRRFVEAADLARAKKALVSYLQTRGRPRHPYPVAPAPTGDYDRQAADLICGHLILNQQLGQEIDWRANPVGYLEWMHAFNRHFFLQTLVEAHLATGDAKYARELDYLIRTWLEVSPMPENNNGGGDPAWETLSAACRINHAWPALWYALSESPDLRPQTRLDMLKSFCEHAQHLIRYPTGHNWLVAESTALARIGILFPEFHKAETWRTVGLERLEKEMHYQVYPDGAQFELTPGYHRMCLNLFADIFELATLNGYPMSRSFVQRLESMFDYSMRVTRPDGTRPSLNDAGSADLSSTTELLRGHGLFHRPDLLYVATSGKQGQVPAGLSHAFPYAGHFVMRTGWERDALWAIVDAGPYGAAHQHEDKLSLELYAYGTRFVVDPGIASYLDDPWTHYARSTAAHNTILVDGQGQTRRTNVPRERYRVEEPEEAVWGSGERLDFVWASYQDGYSDVDTEHQVTHSRLVLFLKPRCWVIWDVLTGQGEHQMEALYHFEPMLVQCSPADGAVRSNRLGLPNIELLPLNQADGVQVVCGAQEPVQGWLAEDGKIVPAPVAIYRLAGHLPLSFGVVAAPFKSGVSSGLSVQPLEMADRPGGATWLGVAISDLARNRYELLFSARPTTITWQAGIASPIAVTGQGIFVQKRPDGQLAYLAGLNCQELIVGDVCLADRPALTSLIEVEIR